MTARDIAKVALENAAFFPYKEPDKTLQAINTDLLLLFGIGLDTPLKADDEQA